MFPNEEKDLSNDYIGNLKSISVDGFDDYIAKPIDIHELDRVIKKYLKK